MRFSVVMRYTDYSSPGDDVLQPVKERLSAALTAPGTAELVAAYFDPAKPFAGRSFDRTGGNPPDEVICDDLLAVSLLGIISWDPRAVRQLLDGEAGRVGGFLARIGPDTVLWEATAGELRAVDELWPVLRGLRGVHDAVASKLLARKRPGLAPITDSVVVTAVGAPGSTWPVLRRCFQDAVFRGCVEDLRRKCPAAGDASLLRVFDVAIWMRYSGSAAARAAREALDS